MQAIGLDIGTTLLKLLNGAVALVLEPPLANMPVCGPRSSLVSFN